MWHLSQDMEDSVALERCLDCNKMDQTQTRGRNKAKKGRAPCSPSQAIDRKEWAFSVAECPHCRGFPLRGDLKDQSALCGQALEPGATFLPALRGWLLPVHTLPRSSPQRLEEAPWLFSWRLPVHSPLGSHNQLFPFPNLPILALPPGPAPTQ